MPSILISADDIKKELPGYTPDKASDFHVQSARIADRRFKKCLQSDQFDSVILMSGGPASGKTEFVTEYLLDRNHLILDGVLPTLEGAYIKIGSIIKAKKRVSIYAIWPGDMRQAYVAFLHRDRKFADKYFFEKHASARATLLWIANTYLDVEIRIFQSVYSVSKLLLFELAISGRNDLIEFLSSHQYNKGDIVKLVS